MPTIAPCYLNSRSSITSRLYAFLDYRTSGDADYRLPHGPVSRRVAPHLPVIEVRPRSHGRPAKVKPRSTSSSPGTADPEVPKERSPCHNNGTRGKCRGEDEPQAGVRAFFRGVQLVPDPRVRSLGREALHLQAHPIGVIRPSQAVRRLDPVAYLAQSRNSTVKIMVCIGVVHRLQQDPVPVRTASRPRIKPRFHRKTVGVVGIVIQCSLTSWTGSGTRSTTSRKATSLAGISGASGCPTTPLPQSSCATTSGTGADHHIPPPRIREAQKTTSSILVNLLTKTYHAGAGDHGTVGNIHLP